jgi:hypothetical protein
MSGRMGKAIAYIVVVGGPHLETPVSYFSWPVVGAYSGILKGITAFPFTLAPAQVSFHCVGRGEIIPRPYELHRLYGWLGVAVKDVQC